MQTSLWFLQELELYKTVKPYRLDFDPEDEDFLRTNVSRVEKHGITVHGIREYQEQLQFDECGFTILLMPEPLVALNYDDPQLVKTKYYSYIETAVQKHSEQSHRSARDIALDHKVRKRDTAFPISHGKNYPDPQPVMVAHIDWTPHTIEKKLRTVVGDEKTDEILAGDYQFCHAWRPLFGPLKDYPLAVCDYTTVDPYADYEPADDVSEHHGVDENYMLYDRPGHQWFYVRDQQATEILLFRQYDNTVGLRSGIPHCAVRDTSSEGNARPRQSIEVELIVYWPSV